ncbi:MAG: hypothetical protein UX60_C0022G0011 [Berkelbacteria bacterium GW2011_GWA2_46_7]|uniref:Uncharacterized protein n=1 Tax=Berkelbacteria bacterium GW2011_GWA2_46_7 TaxID=1618335 RepID=A0A0G1QEU0_9BACT|nr:MAG: hypothetical protein UX60_C0022G0011 [Berkelbacteria bacterium GW2011_GWA2_46_7]
MNMLILFVFWLGIPAFSLALAIFLGRRFCASAIKKPQRYSHDDATVVGWIAGCATLIVCLPSLWFIPVLNWLGEPVAIIAPNGVVRAVIDDRQLLLRWDRRIAGNRVIDLSPVDFTTSRVLQPISSNPKVRLLHYDVTVEAIGTPAARLAYMAKFGGFDTDGTFAPRDNMVGVEWGSYEKAADFISYSLYEFDEYNSRSLAEFYNPMDERQQERFVELLSSALNPQLGEFGLQVKSARFRFESSSATSASRP